MTFYYFDLYLENEASYKFHVFEFFYSLWPKEEFDMHYNLIEACWLF